MYLNIKEHNMREFKFRVWDVKLNEYVPKRELDRNFGLDFNGELRCLIASREKDPFILRQYTGLTDSKGNHIYEGDIIKEHHFEDWGDKIGYEYIGIVVYKEYSDDILYAGYKTIPAKNQNTKFRGNAIQSDCEVIGNVFENSELLK